MGGTRTRADPSPVHAPPCRSGTHLRRGIPQVLGRGGGVKNRPVPAEVHQDEPLTLTHEDETGRGQKWGYTC